MKFRKSRSINDLIEEMAECTVLQTEEIMRPKPNIRRGNKLADRCAKAFHTLTETYGDEGREALKRLFSHGSDDVRSMAACWLLRYCTDESRRVLEEIRDKGRGLVSFEAGQALLRWEEGTWSLDLAQHK